ncbi:trigger factor family protein [bacterium]|nr:trigger factor family protein [bacterium]
MPENILVRQYGEDYINRTVINIAIDGIYHEALRKEKILPVAQAEIKEIISESPLKFVIHIEVFPNIEIDKKYKDIKLEKQKITVSKKEIDGAIEEIEKKFAKFEEATDKKETANM